MTHEETIKRIQDLVPSIMELEFGCEVFVQNYGVSSIILHNRSKFTRVESEYPLDIIGYCGHEYLTNFNEEHITKILGKPITLAVVLRAVNLSNTGVIFVDSLGNIRQPDDEYDKYKDYAWNLSKDNFNDQSDETKEFIGGLLNN